MFKRATESIVENCGSKTLHAVTDLNSSERFEPLCVVEKRTSFWPFKKPSMNSTWVKIADLLTKDSDKTLLSHNIVDKKECALLKQFEESPTLNIGGSLSAKIAKECNMDLKADDKMTLELKIGDIDKNQVSWEKLRRGLEKCKVDLNDPVYLAAKHCPRTTMCVVIESVSTKDDGTMKKDKSLILSADANVEVGKTAIIPKIHPKGSVEKGNQRSFTIPSSTVLAYSCVEFSVTSSGIAKLHAVFDTLDAEPAPVSKSDDDVVDSPINYQICMGKVKAELEPLIVSENFGLFLQKFKLLLTSASDNEFRVMNRLLRDACAYIKGSLGEKGILTATLRSLLGGQIRVEWKDLMSHLGFELPEDGSKDQSSIKYPSADNHGLLNACMGVVDSIADLSSNGRRLLPNISSEHCKVLLNIVETQLLGKDTPLGDPEFHSMINADETTLNFLINSGFLKSIDGDVFTYPDSMKSTLLDEFAILYVFSAEK